MTRSGRCTAANGTAVSAAAAKNPQRRSRRVCMKPSQVPSSQMFATSRATAMDTSSPATVAGLGAVRSSPSSTARSTVPSGIASTAVSHQTGDTCQRVIRRTRIRTPSGPSTVRVTKTAVAKMTATSATLAASSMSRPSRAGQVPTGNDVVLRESGHAHRRCRGREADQQEGQDRPPAYEPRERRTRARHRASSWRRHLISPSRSSYGDRARRVARPVTRTVVSPGATSTRSRLGVPRS